MTEFKTAALEAGKEFVRVLLLGVTTSIIPTILLGVNTANGIVNINQGLVLAVSLSISLLAISKAIDKFLHLWGEATDKEGWLGARGLTYI